LSERCLKWQRQSKVPPIRGAFRHRFLNAKGERTAENHKQIVAVYGAQRFPLVSSPKEHLSGKKFDDDDEMQEEVVTWFKGQAADFYDSGIHKLIPRLNKCLDNPGDYVEK
jgi:hypothetical protein